MQISPWVPQRRDHDVCPETRAVFTDSPPFVLALSALSCFRKFLFGLATRHIFSRIKHREVFSDDFLRAVAFQALGASIPADHVTQRVQAENGVLLHAFHERIEAFVAFKQGQFCKLALCNILESNTHKISRQRKDLDRIDPLANQLIPIGNLSHGWLLLVSAWAPRAPFIWRAPPHSSQADPRVLWLLSLRHDPLRGERSAARIF